MSLRTRWIAYSFLVALMVSPGATAEANQADVTVVFQGSMTPQHTDPEGIATLQAFQPGEYAEWTLDLKEGSTIVQIETHDAFMIESPWQLVPTLDDTEQHDPAAPEHLHPHWFYPLKVTDVGADGSTARAANVTGDASHSIHRLGIPGPGTVTLRLDRDVTPPTGVIDDPESITHFGFRLTTHTNEPAYGDLRIAPAGSPQAEVPFPTTTPSFDQTFPVQGLDPNTTYDVRVKFIDWSGNEAWSEPLQVTTLSVPDQPEPILSIVEPARGSTVPAAPARIAATFDSPFSPVDGDGVRLFFDKSEVFDGFTVGNGMVTWEPDGMWSPGPHSVSIEVRNQAGGLAVLQWSFHVEEQESAPSVGLITGLVTLAVAVAVRRR